MRQPKLPKMKAQGPPAPNKGGASSPPSADAGAKGGKGPAKGPSKGKGKGKGKEDCVAAFCCVGGPKPFVSLRSRQVL